MRLFIPSLGDIIQLSQPWQFTLCNEHRNESLGLYLSGQTMADRREAIEKQADQALRDEGFDIEKLNEAHNRFAVTEEDAKLHDQWHEMHHRRWWLLRTLGTPVELPAGSKLKFDRIYIRKGQSDFDSVTFFLLGAKTKSEVTKHTATRWRQPTAAEVQEKLRLGAADYHARQYIADGTYEYERKHSAKPVRFWVKLEDANKIEGELVPEEPKPEKKAKK